jgi:peptidoglycan hydrolase CwlO-like protein
MSKGSKIVTSLFGWLVDTGLQKEVEALEARNKKLKTKNRALEAKLLKAVKAHAANEETAQGLLTEIRQLKTKIAQLEARPRPVESESNPYD